MRKWVRAGIVLLVLCMLITGCVTADPSPGTTGPSFEDLFPGLGTTGPAGQNPQTTTPPATDPPATEGAKPTQPAITDPPATEGAKPTQPVPTDPPATQPPEQDVTVLRIWMEDPGKTVSVGEKLTFYVEAEFKYKPKSFILWFKSADNTSSTKSAVTIASGTAADNIYKVTLTVTGDMFPGKWTADWYSISDQYGSYVQKSFTDAQKQDVWFDISGEAGGDAEKPEVQVLRIWMEDPGKTVSVGEKLTFYVEAEFKYKPKSFILWFKSADNTSSTKSAVTIASGTAADNIYKVTLTVTGDMFPGKWTADWYSISDQYGSYVQKSFTGAQKGEIWFVIDGTP